MKNASGWARLLGVTCGLALVAACTPASRMVREPQADGGLVLETRSSGDAEAALTVARVVVRNGAGSWVRDASWDEYVVALENAGEGPVQVVDVSLASEHLEAVHPNADLAALERQTSAQLRVLQTAGVAVVAGYAAGALAFASVAGGGSQVGVIAAASAAVVMIPVAAVAGGIYMHKKHKRQRLDRELMQAEIARRALPLPVEIAAGSTREGSWFFPITPAPKQLLVRFQQGGAEREIRVDLPELSQLHIKPQAAPAKAERGR